jgi:uncharacterized membrane protein
MAGAAGLKRKDRICLAAAIILVALSTCYWSAFSINANYTFHTYWDVGVYANDMYYHIYHPGVVHGLQYLSFGEHIAPDQLLVLPIFYLYQSALTLMIVQAVALSLTGLLVFFIASRLLKNSLFGLLLCFAFLISPGMHGMLVFDYHAEFLIIPFVLLTFYFFMEMKRLPFLVSLLLLLGTLESAAFVGLALGAGLLLYELVYDAKEKKEARNERVKLSICIIVLSMIAMAAYAYGAASLSSGYANGSYPDLPPGLQAANLGQLQLSQLVSAFGGSVTPTGRIPAVYVLYALIVVFLGFGIGALLIPEIAVVLALPWLVEGLVLGKVNFFLIFYQYFSYVLGGALVASILAMIAIGNRSNRFRGVMGRSGEGAADRVSRILLVSALVVFMLSPIFIISNGLVNPVQNFLFQTSSAQAEQVRQLYSVISLVPANASVIAPQAVLPHLAERSELGPISGAKSPWFSPQYVLLELNGSVAAPKQTFANYTAFSRAVLASGDYYLYAENGSAELYRLSGNYS